MALMEREEGPSARVLRQALERRKAPLVERPSQAPPLLSAGDPSTMQSRVVGRRNNILAAGKWLPQPPPPPKIDTSGLGQNLPTYGISGGGGSDAFSRLVGAIRAKESGGNYSARNKSSGALGAYQIMPSNLPSWSKAALGRSVSAAEFIRSPQIQDAVAKYQLQQYFNKYGARGTAIAWYAGPGALKYSSGALNRNQSGYPSINNYASDILRRAGL